VVWLESLSIYGDVAVSHVTGFSGFSEFQPVMRSDLISTIRLISGFLVALSFVSFVHTKTRDFHHSWGVALLVHISTSQFSTSHRLGDGGGMVTTIKMHVPENVPTLLCGAGRFGRMQFF
jgi:hypothetical protein